MKTRAWSVAAATAVLLSAGAARAEESVHTTQGVACAQDGTGCTRFQSYVRVRRGTEAPAPVRSFSGASAAGGFAERRVYLNMGAAEAR